MAWSPREPPLVPQAVAACGDAALRLGQRLLECTDDELARLTAVCAPGTLVVIGAEAVLPWVDGVIYLGRAGGLYHATTGAPSVHSELVERAGRARAGSPFAVLLDPPRIVPLSGARSISREVLAAWLKS